MGLNSSKNNTESINWDKLETEQMSSTLPSLKNISNDAERLIIELNVPKNQNTESEIEDNIFTWIKNIDEPTDIKNDSFSDTSPFISSDMYKYLKNKHTDEITSSNIESMKGGAVNNSETSDTSSSPKKNNRKNKKNKNKKFTSSEESSIMSGGELSYLSSSAHTDSNNSEEETTVSVGNNRMLTSSINTSDINLISSDSN